MIVPLLILLIFTSSYEQTIGQKLEGQWVHLKGSWQWEAITRDESVEADVLHLCDNGKFTWMTCTLYRSAGKISMSADRGLCIYKGKWSIEGTSVLAIYHFVDSDLIIWPNGIRPDKNERRSIISIDKNTLKFQNQSYVRCSYCTEESFGWQPTCK